MGEGGGEVIKRRKDAKLNSLAFTLGTLSGSAMISIKEPAHRLDANGYGEQMRCNVARGLTFMFVGIANS